MSQLRKSETAIQRDVSASPSSSPIRGEGIGGLDRLLSAVSPVVARVLDDALAGKDVTAAAGETLLGSSGLDMMATLLAADTLRRQRVGDVVTYVVNRNVNFTNVCIKGCGFCAFSRDFRQEEGYFLPTEEILRRVREAWDLGATEVCVQAGLPPKMEGDLYIKLCRAIKEAVPGIHIHGFSPEEVLYGAVRSQCTVREYLTELQAAGVGSLPGTSAEVLDQEMRDRISPGRITVKQWVEVITTAHALGIRTTSTVMFGHAETSRHVAEHLALIRSIQQDTGGFTEFVPLSFVHTEAPMFLQKTVPGIRPGPTGVEVLKVHAVSRIMLNNWIPNLQSSWVKEGPRMAQVLLNAGVNDLGGTLINESISTSAGAGWGQLVRPQEFRKLIREADRVPAERSTLYKLRHVFEAGDDPMEPLDQVTDKPEERFGTYHKLVKSEKFRYSHPRNGDAPKSPK
ncbi:MAG: 7,8-didemethyl-8-hydroxy-5-deazariboflavin synthase subunit CofH [Dehalococcoidia bacterium]|nr:7,8-didemethyl-8-hydroxy-5-deazariboflavin synthase subunit CofH [Dehalococcoidia bacterium]